MPKRNDEPTFKHEHDLVVLEQAFYATLCNGPLKSLTPSELSEAHTMIMAHTRLYAAAYLDLVLGGEMKSYNTELLCNVVGINRKDIEDLDMFVKKGEMCAGVLKENKKGELDYGENPYYRKGF